MDSVILKDFEVRACHGVNAEEKVEPQRFLISVEIGADISIAAANDDLNCTISYAAVKKVVEKFVKGNCFDLIETIAVRLAELILKSFPIAENALVTVKKPDAPMSGKFDHAAVKAYRAWHKVYLSLGSNEGDREGYLDFAVNELRGDDNFKDVRESTRIKTAPYGGAATGEFLNSAVECRTLLSPRSLLNRINEIESAAGRVRKKRWGDRTLDVDVLFYDDDVVDENDLCIPHIDMINRDFVLIPLAELAPYKVHPLLKKRVCELLAALNARRDI